MNPNQKHRTRAPLDLALSQISDALKTSGKERLAALVAENNGYAQMIWLLEKLSKCSLEWVEHAERAPDSSGAQKMREGISLETEHQLKLKLEGLD
jgi:hypothetical protein